MKEKGLLRYEGQKFEEECPEASIREGPEELKLRAEEVGSEKACINVGHIAEDRWDRPWLTRIGMPFAKESKAANGREKSEVTLEDEGGKR